MNTTLLSIFSRYWEKALFLTAAAICVCLCSIATHYFSDAYNADAVQGRQPEAVTILPWQGQAFFHWEVPSASQANPFRHTLVSLAKPPAPPPKPTPSPRKPAASGSGDGSGAQPSKPTQPDVVFSVCYRGFYVDVRGEALAMLVVTEPNQPEKRFFSKTGAVIGGKLTLLQANDQAAMFQDPDGNPTSVNWNETRTFRFQTQ